MSKHDWKPGDVAMATWPEGDSEVLFRFMGGFDFDVPEWQSATEGCAYPTPAQLRPLVVIDPENREQMRGIAECAADGDAAEWRVDMWQRYFRGLANPKPPRPDEPQGLGAVVEAVCGCNIEPRRYVRDPDARDFNLPHDARNVATGSDVPWVSRCGHHRYSDLTAVRVLSEGVQP